MKLCCLFVFVFLYGSVLASNQPEPINDSIDSSNSKDIILCTNILGPIIFSEAGLGILSRSKSRDYYFYVNYKFSFDEGMVTYFPYEYYGLVKPDTFTNSVSGIDLGAQLRFRGQRHISKKPYAKYIKKTEKKTAFYMGMSTEISYVHSEEQFKFDNRNVTIENWIWTPKLGAILGWTFNNKKVYFDIHWSFALGYSFIAYEAKTSISIKLLGREHSGAWMYKPRFAILLGYKL